MKSIIFKSLSLLLVFATIVPKVRAEAAFNPSSLHSNPIYTSQLKPFNLVSLAHQGYFQKQGIPSYGAFTSAVQSGRINAQKLVQSAVQANRLPANILANRGYLSSVEMQLKMLENVH